MRREKLLKIIKIAQKNNSALPQFNFSEFAQVKAMIAVSEKLKKSFIFGTSEGESNYIGLNMAVAFRKEAERKLGFPVILNLDHGKSFEYLKKAIDAGYDMVHFDGSKLPIKENIKITKKVVSYARKKDVLVEGEIGYLQGASKIHKEVAKISAKDMTKPEEAKEFISKTGVDSLAVVIGNIHGTYVKMPSLDLKRLSMIKKNVGKNIFLVLHGGSGISEREIKEVIKIGIAKININTEIRAAWRNGLEKILKKNPKEIVPYKIMPKTITEIEKVIEEKMKLFSGYKF